ncbi:leukocidin family pore-forming toxin [Aeromonas salmonicida]|uniref:leukocidin family pore-forming toxin n=1 Tax=Aeromonas salmonicida TaxID=645 RepID=UPI00259D417A|nr:leukocidin family pore-forming toxin [Aeromonas salmonicida]MDM5065432.1 leukocidin family pore-forming toxin [Aeromonas salmonicida]
MKKIAYSIIFVSMFSSVNASTIGSDEILRDDVYNWYNKSEIDSLRSVYKNASLWAKNKNLIPNLEQIQKKVMFQKENYVIDFSDILSASEKEKAKYELQKHIGVSLPGDILVISPYKNSILLTPLDNYDALYVSDEGVNSIQDDSSINGLSDEPPHGYTFYVKQNKTFYNNCSFLKSPNHTSVGIREMCYEEPFISLIYKISFQRSFKYGAASDRKIVRVSIDNDNDGTGMKVTSNLGHGYQEISRSWLGQYYGVFSTDAIARNYGVNISTPNTSELTLVTLQPRNENPGVDVQVTNNIALGVSLSSNPKEAIKVETSMNQSRTLSYKTFEYKYELSTPNPHQGNFKWTRSQFSSPQSLLKFDGSGSFQYPVEKSRLSAISHSNFIPFLDIAYEAASTYHGTARVNIDANMEIAPYYHSAQNKCGFPHNHCYSGLDEKDQKKNLTHSTYFNVDFNHPAFTGTKPVTLRLGSLGNRCIDATSAAQLISMQCTKNYNSQAFIYDEKKRYESLRFNGRCLEDANGSLKLNVCTENLNQKWEWVPKSDKLKNLLSGKYMAHSGKGDLGVANEGSTEYPFVNTMTEHYSHN